jgi:hypothetical protein
MGESKIESVVLYASIGGYVIFGAIWGGCLAIAIYDGIPANVVVALAMLLFFAVWLSRYRIILSAEKISYRSLFGGTRTIRIVDIGHAFVRNGISAKRQSKLSLGTIVIEPVEGANCPQMLINPKPFSRGGLRKLLNFLNIADTEIL